MSELNRIELAGEQIKKELEIDSGQFEDRLQLLKAIESRVEYLLEREPGLLFSYLYRLDVSEQEIKRVLNIGINPIGNIALLIYNRQIRRIETKLKIEQKPIEGWEW